jgi:DNA-binding Lrp family transcriptional regulator
VARLESQDNPNIIHALLTGKLLTFSSLAIATGIPTTTLSRRLKMLEDAGVVSFYELAGSYGLSVWLHTEKLGFKTALEILENNEHTSRPFRIYTVGYEGQTPESFLKTLKSNGLERLVDVREIANSRKAGFSSSILGDFLRKHNIEYIHMKGLGSPQNARREFHRDNDFISFSEKYESFLADRRDDLNTLTGLAIEKPTAIMCFERDASTCHRSMIASRIARLGFDVRNL